MEGPGTVVQEEVEALATLALHVVEEDTEEVFLCVEALFIQFEGQIIQSPALYIRFNFNKLLVNM